jgi:hypothetical protein
MKMFLFFFPRSIFSPFIFLKNYPPGRNSRLGAGLSNPGTLACAGFAIATESETQPWPTKPHSQEWLCYLIPAAPRETRAAKNTG